MQIARRQIFHAGPRASGQTSQAYGEWGLEMSVCVVWHQNMLQTCCTMQAPCSAPGRSAPDTRPPPPPPSVSRRYPRPHQQAGLARAPVARSSAACAARSRSSSAEVVAEDAPDAAADDEHLAGLLILPGSLRRSGMRHGQKRGNLIVRNATCCAARGCGKAARVGTGSREQQKSDWWLPGKGFGLALTGLRRG